MASMSLEPLLTELTRLTSPFTFAFTLSKLNRERIA